MSDAKKMKRKLKSEIDDMDKKELERIENDKSRLRKWAKRVLSAAWSTIKSAIGGWISSLFL
ncbi:hypothetical protein RYH80_08670 [Halobaculum sp. MBLA0147]|uniref:hypothetical protein n=1 Tax=Halobaculum sp. MBLA0147 TaxID=3079934 RepID=UPI0035247613